MRLKPGTADDASDVAAAVDSATGTGKRAGTTIAALWLVIAVLAWFAVYQGSMAFIVRAPDIADLSRVTGRITRVDTPVPRNRNDPYSELVIEVAPARVQRVSVRHLSLERTAIEELEGTNTEVRFAGKRPRNRWAYEVVADGRTVLSLHAELERDDQVRRTSLVRAIISAGLAGGLLMLTLRRIRSLKRQRPAA